MMRFFAQSPPPSLQDCVACFWYTEGEAPYSTERILPSHTLEVIFNLGTPSRVLHLGGQPVNIEGAPAWVVGLQTGYIEHQVAPLPRMYGIRILPWGASRLFPFGLHELTNRLVPLDAIWGAEARRVRERLGSARTHTEGFDILQNAVQARLCQAGGELGLPTPLRLVYQEVQQLASKDGALFTRQGELPMVSRLTEQAGVSQRHLIALFRRYLGVTPKEYLKLIRLNRALQEIERGRPASLADLSYLCGFSDQSHFHKDFRAATGMPPGEFLKRRDDLLKVMPPEEADAHFVPV